jgi:hypothetical protein
MGSHSGLVENKQESTLFSGEKIVCFLVKKAFIWTISIPLPPDQFLRERTQESFLVSAIALVFKRTAGRWLYRLGLGGTQVLRLKGHDAPRMKILRISLEQAESLLSPGIC